METIIDSLKGKTLADLQMMLAGEGFFKPDVLDAVRKEIEARERTGEPDLVVNDAPEYSPVAFDRSPSWRDRLFVYVCLVAVVASVWAAFATFYASDTQRRLSLALDDARQARQGIGAMQNEIHQMRQEVAQADAHNRVREALHDERLHQVYPGIRSYKNGRNAVNQQYLEAFEVDAGRLKTYMKNHGPGRSRPDFEIYFLNQYGFVTGSFSKRWVLDSIGPGQSRVDDDLFSARWRFGAPVYFYVEFN